jgi:hypothetical protein
MSGVNFAMHATSHARPCIPRGRPIVGPGRELDGANKSASIAARWRAGRVVDSRGDIMMVMPNTVVVADLSVVPPVSERG